MLKIGSKDKEAVKELQQRLNLLINAGLTTDGIYGRNTAAAVWRFQDLHTFAGTGEADMHLLQVINTMYKRRFKWWHLPQRFCVFVDAGHSGITMQGKYITRGKYMQHPPETLMHDGRGMYYEGLENRFVAEMFIEQLTAAGIMSVRVYDIEQDTSLGERCRRIKSYLDRGYYGYMHSFHSNAISMNSGAAKLEATQGGIVFTSKAFNKSDIIADIHHKELTQAFGSWVWGQKKKQFYKDWEANFKILRDTDLVQYSDRFGAMLEEYGFHTSLEDTRRIIRTRSERAAVAVQSAIKIKNNAALWQNVK